MDKNEVWDELVKFYKDAFGFDEALVNKESAYYILKASLSGFSNSEIASAVGLPEDVISGIVNEFTGFSGFYTTQVVNPIAMYRSGSTDVLEAYDGLLEAVKRFEEIDNELKEKWI